MSADNKTYAGQIALVVDDESVLREVISETLATLGFKVLEADGGDAALQVLSGQKVDLVISDVRMPGGSGVDLLKGLSKLSGPKPVVVMASGFSDLGLDEATRLGASAMIAKPFRGKALLELVKQLLPPSKVA